MISSPRAFVPEYHELFIFVLKAKFGASSSVKPSPPGLHPLYIQPDETCPRIMFRSLQISARYPAHVALPYRQVVLSDSQASTFGFPVYPAQFTTCVKDPEHKGCLYRDTCSLRVLGYRHLVILS